MKRMKRFTALVLALVMVCGLTVSVSAAAVQTVTVQLSPNITVTLDGEPQTMADVNGNPVYPVLYGGTTYLPVRAVGNMLGLDVDWEQATQTVILEKSDGKTTPAKTSGKTPANAKPTDITVQINPNITVKYNGKTQEMKDTNGNPVYPMLYGGTTYLPVRAVSNMLGVKVDWDGDTQTVLLKSNAAPAQTAESKTDATIIIPDENGQPVEINLSNPEDARKKLKSLGFTDEEIQQIYENSIMDADSKKLFDSIRTSADAKTLGENHIGYDWAEIDWSTADKGYVRVKVNEQLTAYTRCTVRWYEEETEEYESHNQSKQYAIPESKWTNIPLTGNTKEYAISIDQGMNEEEFKTLENADLRPMLWARFTGKPIDENALWLLSYGKVDYENAPEVCAKAQELTKDCKTDAEKITVIFEYVAKTIKYDQPRYEKIIADTIAKRTGEKGPSDPLLEERQTLSETMSSKKGICDDYANLMAAMLRSIGIPCKVCVGPVYTGRIIKNYSDDGWEAHAWVAVKPETGTLDMKALGAGKDFEPVETGVIVNSIPTGWIRLDPTWGSTSQGRADAAIDKNHITSECY